MESSDDDDDGKFLADLLEQHNYAEADPADDSEWTNIPIISTEVGIDNVDKYLLSTARREVETVKNNFLIRVFGASEGPHRAPASLEPAIITNEFLDDQFLAQIRSQINKHIIGERGDPFSTEEVVLFIRVQLYLCVYGCSPSLFFDKKNRDIYPTSGLGMSHRQYTAALQALGKSSSMYCDNSGCWMPPMEHDCNLAGVLEHVRRTSANIGFVPRITLDETPQAQTT